MSELVEWKDRILELENGTLSEILFSDTTIILDTNCFLELYRYSATSHKAVLATLTQFLEVIWIPYQVYDEYIKNYENVIRQQHNKYKSIEINLNKEIETMQKRLSSFFKVYESYDFPEPVRLAHTQLNKEISTMKNVLSDLKVNLERDEKHNETVLKKDEIFKFVEHLKVCSKIGTSLTTVDKLKIYQEGEIRYKFGIPPGYEDIDKAVTKKSTIKNANNMYGDLIIWKSILNYAASTNKSILFVTNDLKNDWWEEDTVTKNLVPRSELIEEFKEYSSGEFKMINLKEFTSLYGNSELFSKKAKIELEATRMVKDFFAKHDFNEYNSQINEQWLDRIIGNFAQQTLKILESKLDIIDDSYIDLDDQKSIVSSITKVTLTIIATIKIFKLEETVDIESVIYKLEGYMEMKFTIDEKDLEDLVKHNNFTIEKCLKLEFPAFDLVSINVMDET